MSLTIADSLVVSMHYKLTDSENNVLDTSEGAEPLDYLHGTGNIIPGLEKAMLGKAVGDTFQVTVSPEEGYGEINPEMVQIVDREIFQGADAIEVGMTFEAESPDGSIQSILVVEVNGDDITIDANHPLAGMELNFEIEVVNIREATPEELEHGHAH